MKEEQESVVGGIGEGRRQERWEHELGLKKEQEAECQSRSFLHSHLGKMYETGL